MLTESEIPSVNELLRLRLGVRIHRANNTRFRGLVRGSDSDSDLDMDMDMDMRTDMGTDTN